MPDDPQTPLTNLQLHEKPDPQSLLTQIKEALQRANHEELWDRMQHAHDARFAIWEGHKRSCRKPTLADLPPGMKPEDIVPWPGAADLEVRLTDEIINEFGDLLIIAEGRAQKSIMPSMLDVTAEERMTRAEGWGAVSEYYKELAEYERGNAIAQWADIAWEYGHSVMFVGWKEEKHVEPRTISVDDLVQLVTVAVVTGAEAQARALAQEQGRPVPEDPQQSMLSQAEQRNLITTALQQLEDMIHDPAMRESLMAALMGYDKEMPRSEAMRVARTLKKGEPVTYHVAVPLCSMPDWRALTPGLDVFYPPETTRIQEAPFVVLPEWFTKVQLAAKVDEGWDPEWIEEVIKSSAGRAVAGVDLFGERGWVLSRGKVGMEMRPEQLNRPDSSYYQVLTVYYRSTAMGGVPALYKTVLHGNVKDKVGYHTCCEHAHGRYPLADYVRERKAVCLWDSRGVGELSFSEQEEIRIQTNAKADNASLLIAPPVEVPLVPGRSGKQLIAPRVQIPVKRTGGLGDGIRKIDLAGDFSGSMEVEASTMARSNRYWLRGVGPDIDPLAKQNRQQRIANDWVAAVKEAEKLGFKLIQQFTPERIRATAVNGQPIDLDLSRADIQGQFSLQLEFDVGVLDPKTVESRMKMLQQYVSAMDREGLMKTEPLLRLMTMMINPTWSKLLVNDSKKAQMEDADDITGILSDALNGIEKPYIKGKNHAMRAQLLQQLIEMPLIQKGQPVMDETTGRPMPNRILRIIQENPDVAELVKKRIEFETIQAQQFENAEIGRTGVQPTQPQAQV
jgi:hypothetical protein